MITISRTKRFNSEYKKFVKHDLQRAESIIKSIELFIKDPKYPSLNVEKLTNSNAWTMRLSKENRLFFLWINDTTILLVDVGPHDKYRKY